MINLLVKCINIQHVKNFILSFTLFVSVIMICRLFTSETLDFSRDLGYVVSFSVMFALLNCLWNKNKNHLILCAVFIGIYLLSAILKRCTGMILQEREITHTVGTALILFSLISLIRYTSQFIKSGVLKVSFTIITAISAVLFILPALVFIGYAAVNGGIFSSDIMLTLFQTNSEEVKAYLQDKNLWQWGLGDLCIITVIVLYVRRIFAVKSDKFCRFGYILALIWLSYLLFALLPKLNLCSLINIVQTTKTTLDGFDEFEQTQNERLARLKDLIEHNQITSSDGLYVLVIGESESRDHMQLYGYERKTTPWLNKLASNENTFVFKNAYSNHTHTVPTLTYALSGKNQYNDIEQTDAFSVIEVAKAAGYKTYWLSNQAKYGVLDTPVTTIATMSDVQSWLNINTGDKIFTSYYDEKLADEIPITDTADKILMIIHLMGSHGAYRDRYPSDFEHFDGKGGNIDDYDNSVLYNDYVLRKIYDKVSKYPNFMAWVYFSDHGDDVDNGLGHESSLFTYQMAEIPLIVNVSDKFAEERAEAVQNLWRNQNAFWTNDLVYDLMINLMEINGLPNNENKYNLLSDKYDLPRDKVKLLHGEKTLQSEEQEKF